MKQVDYRIFIGLVLAGLLAPMFFGTIISQISVGWILIVLAMSWDLQGGQMGYNSFGNICFFGTGMYVGASTQIALFHDLGKWTEASGFNTYIIDAQQYLVGLPIGLLLAGVVCAMMAFLLGLGILKMRGHYFAICTLALGVTAGEIAGGIDLIGGGSGMSVPVYPDELGSIETRDVIFYYISLLLFIVFFVMVAFLRKTKFFYMLNAIRDKEDKAEAMGIETTSYKVWGWVISGFFTGIAGALMGNMTGYIEPIEVAFAGATYGIYMILAVILGGKGTLWGPVLGAIVFHLFNQFFWIYLLGTQRIALGLLIMLIVIFFPKGILGYFQEKRRTRAVKASLS